MLIFEEEIITVFGGWNGWIDRDIKEVVNEEINYIIKILYIKIIFIIFLNLFLFIGLVNSFFIYFFFLPLFFLKIVIGGVIANLSF